MKKLFLLCILAVIASGCGAARSLGSRPYDFNWFPTVDVVVSNDCPKSTLYAKTPRGDERPIKYGTSETIILQKYPGDDYTLLLMVRGVGDDGAYLGSASGRFYVGQNGRREEPWHINYLQGGDRPCR